MIYIAVFISGILFYAVVLPVLDLLVQRLTSFSEVLVSKNNVSISKNNAVIEKIGAECACSGDTVQAIGFSIDSEGCYDEDDEDEEESARKKGRRR